MTDNLTPQHKPEVFSVTSVAAELDRLFPAPSADQLNRFQDLREQTKRFAATLLATVPPGQQREDALVFLKRSVTAAVLGICKAKKSQVHFHQRTERP